MSKELRFDDKVAIVTGAGNGLGRSHALLLAARGAKVVVNDLGGEIGGEGQSSKAADIVVDEIKAAGGEAVGNYDSVVDGEKIVQTAMDTYGRIDMIINNAGILRDTSFAKMSEADWDLIYQVHVKGSYKVTAAAWPHMREQKYGRIIMTASAAGIYGNFGQANYAMAKLGVTGFANTLAREGAGKNIFSNTIAPLAGSRLTETVLPEELIKALSPEYVSPLVAYLCHDSCDENGSLFEVGGGFFGKLRWERTEGKMYRAGRNITPETIKGAWPVITDFSKSTHPSDINESMQPIMSNVSAGPSKGGNEFIDVDDALGYEFDPSTSSYDERDLALYALGVGAGEDPTDDKDLQLVYEMHGKGFKALPSYAVIPAVNEIITMAKEGESAPGLNFGIDKLLHGEQYTELIRPLPPHAKLTHKSSVKSIYDKGKNALVTYETKSYDQDDSLMIVNELTAVIRGAGGWGGDRGPKAPKNVAPSGKPDFVTEQHIGANQALLYRLSGDWNPLHVDPNMAKAFGFEKPILHGLCTFGHATRHVINACFPDADPRYFKSINLRFADSVYPGETLITEMWKDGDNRVVFQCKVKGRGKVVISNAAIERYAEIPKAVPKNKADAGAADAAAQVSAEPNSADIFTAIAKFVQADASVASQIQTVFQFRLTGPDSLYTVDLKNGGGSVSAGETAKSECILELSDADFMDMCTGKADAQKLYFGGKLKICGNVMASQKLTFLSKLDPQLVVDAANARVATGGGAAAAAAPAESTGPNSADIFVAMRDYVERNPEIVSQVGVVFQFKLTDPESVWTLDAKNGKGSVEEGETQKPECTLELTDANFMGMTSGELDGQKLYFGGELKISGNVIASQKLTFLQKIDPEQAKEAVKKARAEKAAGTGATAPKAAAKPAAPGILEKLSKFAAANPGVVSEVASKMQWNITGPYMSWAVDFSAGAGTATEGTLGAADVTFTISDDDLAAMASGAESIQSLYQNGKLRIDGDIQVAHRLSFFQEMA
ncbi:MAG: SDR family NAD(P)-dependent oxidoreductase [Myxococcales bacterium]|nr:SDR family NAD(P)-dependent oxidoreductase [Myxococcales bacterium]